MRTQTPLRLRKRAEFLALRSGKQKRTPYFFLQYKKRKEEGNKISEPARLGFTVSRKNGNAVIRNRIKRRLREAAELNINWDEAKGYDYAIIARPACLNAPFQCLIKEMRKAILNKVD